MNTDAVTRLIKRAFNRNGEKPDLTGDGERVDIDLTRREMDYESFDMYQKSHFKRYQFASSKLAPRMLVGDFACGTAYGTAMLARTALQAFGCDLNADVVSRMKNRYRKIKNLTLLQGDLLKISDLPRLDFIASFETVEHFPETLIPGLFEKFNELLKPGGSLIFSTPYLQPQTEAAMKHHKTFEIDELKIQGWMEQAGFRVVECHYQNYATHDIAEALNEKDFVICLCRKE